MATVDISKIGPIDRFTFDLGEGGGITEIRGTQGLGKSTTLAAVDAALNGVGSLALSDGESNGFASVAGITIKVSKQSRRSGVLEVTALEDRLDIGGLIDPGIKDPIAADRHRIEKLVALAGSKADPELFRPLLGAAFDLVTSPASRGKLDIISMAESIKRDIESHARESEENAQRWEGHAKGLVESAAKVDVKGEADPIALQLALEKAIREESAIAQRAKNANASKAARDNATAQLESARSTYTGPTVEVAQEEADIALTDFKLAEQAVKDAETKLQAARDHRSAEQAKAQNKAEIVRTARAHFQAIAAWESQLTGEAAQPVDEAELTKASEAVVAARKAVETGALIRKAQSDAETAKESQDKATKLAEGAKALRDAAAGVFGVVSSQVAKLGVPLQVEGGRLLTADGEPFARLSDGERAIMAVELAIGAVGPGGAFTINQRTYGEISPANKQRIHQLAKEAGVRILAAVVTDDPELVAVPLN